jgi:hypothetical protein
MSDGELYGEFEPEQEPITEPNADQDEMYGSVDSLFSRFEQLAFLQEDEAGCAMVGSGC